MTRHTFLACDACNQIGVRVIEQRRRSTRDFREGRRTIDGRAWVEGTEEEARLLGWEVLDDGRHLCPDCRRRGLRERLHT